MKLFLVDAVSTFRNSYVIRCNEQGDALDAVALNEANEFSQEWLGETTSRVREITEDDYLVLFDKDNEYLKEWSVEQKKSLIHQVKYDQSQKAYDPMTDGKAEI